MNYPVRQSRFALAIFIFLLLPVWKAAAQDSVAISRNKYGLPVVSTMNTYRKTIVADSNQQMVNVKKLIPNVVLDLRYAGSNNFMHMPMYPKGTKQTYLRLPAARALQKAEHDLNERGLGFKIFDAYRPFSVTEKFWEIVHDERYVANPKNGSGHNRGIAVDLTIIDLKTGKELDMGTGFDNFTDSAHESFSALPAAILDNRRLLRETMEKYGFKQLETEWWHYSLPDPNNYPILDLDISKGRKYFRE